MKVLQVINSLRSGGAEKLIVDTCAKFSEKGLKVDVLLLDGVETGFLKKLKANKNVNILYLGKENNIYNPFLIFKIKSFFKNYDIIHAHLFPTLYWVGFANLLNLKKHNIVLTEHNTTNRRRKLFLFKALDKIAYNQFNKIITISDAVDDNLKNHLGEKFKPKFIKIYNGINLEAINLAKPYKKEDLHFSDADKLIIQVSSFTPQKDQKTLIKAISKLPNNFKLILVGKGPLEASCKQLANELGITDRVHFYGVRNDVPQLLKTADVVVLSSFYEGLSLSSIEGMASGKPFIASDVPGLTEVVENAGVLFEKEDDNQLKKIIIELFDNNSYYNDITKACLKKSQLFDINIMVDNYHNLYKTLH
ncbi:glycosyl transferase [Seonamhaeicola sp. S2-3]|uniref:glycosyltransferase n=1 Tax=Seonamhaeicola sp. S2-3 TaxID=1936081 RepID=UPI000972D96C|nr:glycosyltransferase [Seonamhaeicola sp. S2-3]APY12408.1 glycosyl transferase [Seonamhaeicola sp. S2-3]